MIAAPSTLAVRVTELVKEWASGPTQVAALRGVSLEIRRGERVALLGKSGSGKSTLLNLLGGLDRPTAGSIQVNGRELARMRGNELARYRLQTIGMVFQSFHLIASRSALANVELPLVFAGVPTRQRREQARQALEAVGLGHRLEHRPTELSGGEQQRVAIARALVNRPGLLLADEPTGNLDCDSAAAVMAILETHLREHGATLVLVTHDEELARRCANRILRLRDGLFTN